MQYRSGVACPGGIPYSFAQRHWSQRKRDMQPRTFIPCVLVCTVLAACSADDPYRRTKAGSAIGAASGAIIGGMAGDSKTALIGAAAGALAGGLVGNYMDTQQRDFERALAEEQRRNALQIERLKDETLKLRVFVDRSVVEVFVNGGNDGVIST